MFQDPYLNVRNAIFYSINTFDASTVFEVEKMIFDIVGLCKDAETTGLFCFDHQNCEAVIIWRIIMDKIYEFEKDHDRHTKELKSEFLLVNKELYYPE